MTDFQNDPLTPPEIHVEPPYPGAIQDELAWHLVKYLPEDARLETEVAFELPQSGHFGPAFFTVDLVVTLATGTRIGFDVSGSHRNLRDHDRLLRRDATLLDSGSVQTLYRLRGSDLLHRIEDVLWLASEWDPAAFSARGAINLRTLALPETKAAKPRPEQPSVLVSYPLDGEPFDAPERNLWHVANGKLPHILVRRLSVENAAVWKPYASTR